MCSLMGLRLDDVWYQKTMYAVVNKNRPEQGGSSPMQSVYPTRCKLQVYTPNKEKDFKTP
jgi:hypothetical protein